MSRVRGRRPPKIAGQARRAPSELGTPPARSSTAPSPGGGAHLRMATRADPAPGRPSVNTTACQHSNSPLAPRSALS
eukprot:3694698-Alexandrium_andersonii.AAC.1